MLTGAARLENVKLGQIRAVAEKARILEEQGRDVIHLEIGEPDFTTPHHIVTAAQEALCQGYVHYSPNRGLAVLRESISTKLKSENAIHADPETEIIVTTGAAEALFLAFLGHCNPGDEVIIIEPAYINYQQLAHMAGAQPISVGTREENGWVVDPKDIQNAITPRTKMIVINSPSNPTGAVYPKTVLEEIAELAIQNELLILSDEIYEKLIYQGNTHVSIASFPGMNDRTITVNGFSKAYAMTGWRLGYIVAVPQLMTPMLKIHQYALSCAATFAQYGANAAITQSQECVKEMVAAYIRRRNMVCEGLSEIDGISCHVPQGAFYVFPNIKSFGLSSAEFADMVLNEVGVALVPGSVFSSFGEGYVRFSYAVSDSELQDALFRLKECLKNKL